MQVKIEGKFTPNFEIKQLRENYGMSKECLARVLGASVGTISRWEKGYKPSPAYLKLIFLLLEEFKKA